nr:MAG TPA: hypothetical protein [Caudoviricetes sp.]
MKSPAGLASREAHKKNVSSKFYAMLRKKSRGIL